MAIVEEDIERVRSAVSLVDVVSPYVQLKRVGRNQVGLCPFHAERTGSFNVRDEIGRYHCFGCGASGDVFRFVQDVEHVDFVVAVEQLAGKAGITLRYTTGGEGRDRSRRKELLEAVEAAVEWYHQRLLTAPDGRAARDYLRSRGIDGAVARRFRLGWAPDDWDALVTGLARPERALRESGLAFLNRRNRLQDTFRARLLFPILNEAGEAVAFGGRILPGSTDPAKYKNSPETEIYRKSRVLYGLSWAKSDIVKADRVVVCEGYTDVIGFHQAGVPIAVATCGTALTEDHVRLLKRFASRVVLAFDADAAGQGAAERFYEWERSSTSPSRWRGCRGARTRPTWPVGIRRRSGARSRRPSRSWASGWAGCCGPAAGWRRRRPRPSWPTRPWPWSASTPTSTSASSTPVRWPSTRACPSPTS